ncbi:MAG: GFA family protein [Novosphingobium sp.]
MRIAGGCHCGAVRFECEVAQSVDVLDCNCSACSATGFLHLVVPHQDFSLKSGVDNLTVYSFGTGKARHLFCRTCGIKSFYQPRSHPDCWSVNLRCVTDAGKLTVTITPFDGRNWEQAASQLKS